MNCEDPMSSAALPITRNCMVPKENHVGKFPANYCVKMIGTSSKNNQIEIIKKIMLAPESPYYTKQLGGSPLLWRYAQLLENYKRQ